MTTRTNNACVIFTGICPDEKCGMKLYFPYFEEEVLCHHCGQKHPKQLLKNTEEVTDIDSVFRSVLRGMLMNVLPPRGPEAVKVLGLSNYHCKLLSPLLTKYGMDKETGKAKPLSAMNQGDIFDCGLFGDRAFLIDPEHISIEGFGRDKGSLDYLASTLDLIKTYNNQEERLVPIHADGDGHCLVHAISRALVGRELFWHPLRCSLKRHLEDNLSAYKALFKEFVDESDWKAIVEECDPEFLPTDGEGLGLRNIHVFGLANVLKRPIILLDTAAYMDKKGDYAALFLPSMVQSEFCRGKDGHLNKPLCIAWSSIFHNHYIPLVGIKKSPLPVLPRQLLPKVWGVPQDQIDQYIEFNESDCCTIGGDRSLGDPYILRLVSAMEEQFFELNKVHPSLVSDVHHYLYKCTGALAVRPSIVIKKAFDAVCEDRLYRCLTCNAINEQIFLPGWFKSTGLLYNMALRNHGVLRSEQTYAFPARGILCRYNAVSDELVPDTQMSYLDRCYCCEGFNLRKVSSDGSIIYKNKDRTKTPSKSSLCSCGFKHYWDGKEYDNLPQHLNVSLEWNNKIVKDVVVWFQNESDSSLNSNVYQVASEVVQKYFPGVFGIERLEQRVVDQILEQTKPPEIRPAVSKMTSSSPSTGSKGDCSPSKIIIGGTGVLHREELGVSSTEQKLLRRIETRAYRQQKRQACSKTESPEKLLTASSVKAERSILDVDHSKTCSQNLEESLMPKTAESAKFVKVVTSDGRQAKLELGEGITFETLQKWIYDNFQIAPDNQTIKYGFPLQVLHPSSTERGSILSLSPGQRIVVEFFQPSEYVQPKPNAGISDSCIVDGTGWHSLIENLTKREQDPFEVATWAFLLSSTVSGLSPWEYSKTVPQVYEPNGTFYRQIKHNLGLSYKTHGTLPLFPDKVFAYNPVHDRIDLCCQPYGHYQIKVGLDEMILKCEKERNLQSCFSYGMNCSASDNMKKQTDRVPFQGTGYTLKDCAVKSQPKEDSVGKTHKSLLTLPPPVHVRKGPGFSVLCHGDIPSSTERLEGLSSSDAKEEEKLHGGVSLPSRQAADVTQHMESLSAFLSHNAVATQAFSDDSSPLLHDAFKAGQDSVDINSMHVPVGKGSSLSEHMSTHMKAASSVHGNSVDNVMDVSARDSCESVGMILGKSEESFHLSSTLLDQNVEVPDEAQAMDVDRIIT